MKFDFQIDQREEEKDNSGFLPDVKEALSIQEDQDDDEIMQNSVVDEVDGGEVMEEEEEVVQVNAPLTVDTVLSNISELSNPELLSKGRFVSHSADFNYFL